MEYSSTSQRRSIEKLKEYILEHERMVIYDRVIFDTTCREIGLKPVT